MCGTPYPFLKRFEILLRQAQLTLTHSIMVWCPGNLAYGICSVLSKCTSRVIIRAVESKWLTGRAIMTKERQSVDCVQRGRRGYILYLSLHRMPPMQLIVSQSIWIINNFITIWSADKTTLAPSILIWLNSPWRTSMNSNGYAHQSA